MTDAKDDGVVVEMADKKSRGKKKAGDDGNMVRVYRYEWERELLWTRDHTLRACVSNLVTIMSRHPQWRVPITVELDGVKQEIHECVLGYDEMLGNMCWLNEPPFFFEAADPRFSGGRFKRGRAISDDDITRIADWMARNYRCVFGADSIESAASLVAQHTRFHAVQDYLNGLEWDGVPRLDTWLRTYLCAIPQAATHDGNSEMATRYLDRAGRYWLLQAVARAMEPGVEAHGMLVLEGMQGIGKSAALKTLCPDRGWFFDGHIDLGNKEAFMTLRGRWIIEFAEFYALTKQDQARAKHFITMATDDFVEKYESRASAYPRTYVLASSINPQRSGRGYLLDQTGNRRYYPIACDPVQVSGQRVLPNHQLLQDRDQLWAEAVVVWRGHNECLDMGRIEQELDTETAPLPPSSGGFCAGPGDRCLKHRWWPTDLEQRDLFDPEQNARTDSHPWAAVCFGWANMTINLINKDGWTLSQLANEALEMTKDKLVPKVLGDLGDALLRDGWTVKRVKRHGRARDLYLPPVG